MTKIKSTPKPVTARKRKPAPAKPAQLAAPAPKRVQKRVAAEREAKLDFADAAMLAAQALAACETADECRAVFKLYVGTLGLKALGRVFVYGADMAIRKRAKAEAKRAA